MAMIWRGFYFYRRRMDRRRVLRALAFLLMALALTVLFIAATQMRPLLESLATTRVSNTVTRIVSEAVYEAIEKGELQYDGLVSFEKDTEGHITAVQSNMGAFNHLHAEMLDTFLTLCEQEGVSILFSTHITSDLDTCADTITYIQNGRVAVSEKKQALTGAYLSVQGPDAACGAALRGKLIGARSHKGELDALIRAEDAPLAAGLSCTPANLEQIMVHLEREAEA